jgi:polar amino acid transport system substrate-binding protein
MPMIRILCRWAVLMLVLASATVRADELSDVISHRVLRVAVPSEFPPFGFIYKGLPDGYDIAIARMLALDLDVRLELVPVASSERIPALQSGKVDLIIASLGRTPEREKILDFSVPYAPLYLGVFGDRDAAPTAGFIGRRIGVSKGSLEEAELVRRTPQATIVRLENSKAIIEAYLRGDIEFMAVGSAVVESVTDITKRDRLKLHLLIKDSPCYIGMRKSEPALLARVNKFLKDASDSQAMTVNAMVWFKATLPPDFFRQAQAQARP